MPDAAPQEAPVAEQLLSPESEQLLRVMSDSYARGDGYSLQFKVDPQDNTFSTTCTLDEKGAITVRLSPDLLARAEAEDRLDFLGFAVLHELGHVKRYQAQPPKAQVDGKDGYFTNIVDDIAINYGNASRTRFVHDMTKRVYDDYLFPQDARPELAHKARHQQFMETLLVLAMTTDAHAQDDVAHLLEEANLSGLDDAVIAAVGDILAHEQNGQSFNLLGQLRAYGQDLRYTAQVATAIREHYDALFEADKEDQQQSEGEGQGQGNSQGDGQSSDGEGQSFDYSDSASCGHGTQHIDQPKPENGKGDKASKTNDKSADPSDAQKKDDGSEGSEPLDVQAIAKEIADNIKQTLPDMQANVQDTPRDFTPEQLAALRTELGLDEADFAGYMAARREFANEIQALQDILLELRRERQNEFLAPGREAASHGHRVRIDRLVRAIASRSLGDQPDIWKHPSMTERIEHEFDGLDMYLLCDISGSMAGAKAQAAAASSVVLEEGLLGASSQMAGEHEPVVRLQIQAFGAGYEMLCKLTDEPNMKDLGRTYSSLSNPTSGNTEAAGALDAIKPEPGRLSVVVVVSDGAFHDSSLAEAAGQKLANQNAAIIQLVFGGAEVSKLADNAHRINIAGARELPEQLLTLLPELIQVMRSSTHA